MEWKEVSDNVYWNSQASEQVPVVYISKDTEMTHLSDSTKTCENMVTRAQEEPAHQENKNVLKNYIDDFVDRSTLHGLQCAYGAHSKLRRSIWTLMILASTVCLIGLYSSCFSKYMQYPVQTKTSYVKANRATFPAVTLCNVNRYTKISGVEGYSAQNLTAQVWDILNITQNNFAEAVDRVLHQINDMLVECVWRASNSCSYQNFSVAYTRFGKCYTFNAGK